MHRFFYILPLFLMMSPAAAQDPQRRLEIEWYDVEKRQLPSTITVFGAANRWTGPA